MSLVELLIGCLAPLIINESKHPWGNQLDRDTLARATTRCSFYYKQSPCLKKLIKKDERRYWAVCGKPNE